MNVVKLLLQYPQCALNVKTYVDYYPFDLARARGNYDVIKVLAVARAPYEDLDVDMALEYVQFCYLACMNVKLYTLVSILYEISFLMCVFDFFKK